MYQIKKNKCELEAWVKERNHLGFAGIELRVEVTDVADAENLEEVHSQHAQENLLGEER